MPARGEYEYLHLTGDARATAKAYIEGYRQFLKERAEFVRGLGAGERFLAYTEGWINAVEFDKAPGKGWKESGAHKGYWVPDRRYKLGKEMAQKFGNFRAPVPTEAFDLVRPCGFESCNIQPAVPGSGGASLMVNGHINIVGDEFYLVMPHRKYNDLDGVRGRKRKAHAALPNGIRLVREWEFLKAVDEADEKAADKKAG